MAILRVQRIKQQIKKETTLILQEDLKDPRIGFVTITDVQLSSDLKYAKIYVSIFGDEEDKNQTMQGLKSATGFIRSMIGKRIRLRYTPEIIFEQDNSLDNIEYINKLLEEVKSKEQTKVKGN